MTPYSDPGPLSLPSLSQVREWDTEHLVAAATHWTSTAERWEQGFTAVNTASAAPGGMPWEGVAADEAFARTYRDRLQVIGLADELHSAARVARSGSDELDAAKSRVMSTVLRAQQAGFRVDDDLTVRDTRVTQSASGRAVRTDIARDFASDLGSRTADLVAIDKSVASRLTAIGAGFQGFRFPEAPPPQEPPPPQVPEPQYTPKVWGACKLSGADPTKVVRTFYRAPLSAGFRSLPGGDTQLYCGNDKYGFLHIANSHGPQWTDLTFPWMGNWRNTADYAISAALAYPESVTYRQDNDTFAVERAIYPTDSNGQVTGPSMWKVHVVVSASDGKIITASPISTR